MMLMIMMMMMMIIILMMSNRMEYKKQMMMMVLYPHKNHQRVLTVFTVANKSQPCESATGSSSVTPHPTHRCFIKKILVQYFFIQISSSSFLPLFIWGVADCTQMYRAPSFVYTSGHSLHRPHPQRPNSQKETKISILINSISYGQ